jgi:DNA-binding GntR family transcriptional regulator
MQQKWRDFGRMSTVTKLAAPPKDSPRKTRVQRGAIQVYEALRDDILWLRLAPGSAVDEVTLAKRFDVSRTPIREALMLLAGDGLVVFLANRTTIVLPLSLHNTGEFMDMYLLMSRAVVRGAVLNVRPEHSGLLRSALADVIRRLDSAPAEEALRADMALRLLIGDIASNSFQNKAYRQILDAGIRCKIIHFFPNSTAEDLRAMQDHWTALIEAIENRRADAADRIVTAMIEAEGEIILRSLAPRYGHVLSLP